MKNKNNFVVFPALGYWEIDGKPVSAKEAQYGLNPKAIWRETEVAKNLTQYIEISNDEKRTD